MAFPYEINAVDKNINKELLDHFKGQKTGFVQVGPKKWFLPEKYKKHAANFYNFEVKKDDLWIVTYPRSGTTLNQELLWLLNNNLDYETAANVPLAERFPFFEFNVIADDKFLKEVLEMNNYSAEAQEEVKKRDTPGYEIGKNMKSPRHFKTHLPLSLLPPNLIDTCKVVYIARNPFDVSISFYHHNKKIRAHDFHGSFQKYWEFFEKNLVLCTPYWEHIREGWQNRNHSNLLFIFYEDLIRDKPGTIRKMCSFLNKEISDDDLNKLIEHINYDNFQKTVPIMKPKILGLVNRDIKEPTERGKIGGKEEFKTNNELRKRAEDWVKTNSSDVGIEFPMTL
ncbi:hypothetical protein O3M35_010637 [Rhynocoris fuscipes]|uniref:Sulfotransferase domain-containing protein n=1 Tax=Rhynocoris fuscipes TaxID=488301 RepID=A0AAW1D2F7_9HEMI